LNLALAAAHLVQHGATAFDVALAVRTEREKKREETKQMNQAR
jgi:hypothetical protein